MIRIKKIPPIAATAANTLISSSIPEVSVLPPIPPKPSFAESSISISATSTITAVEFGDPVVSDDVDTESVAITDDVVLNAVESTSDAAVGLSVGLSVVALIVVIDGVAVVIEVDGATVVVVDGATVLEF